MMCDHCGQPIAPGERYERIPVDTPSGAVPDVIRHRRPCVAPPHQTTGPAATALTPWRTRR
jgi:hypothetical protein